MRVQKLEEENEGVAITCLGVVGQISFGNQMLEQEATDPWTE
jgi:hypothetical protein